MAAEFEIITYDGLLICPRLGTDGAQAVRTVFTEAGLEIDIIKETITFAYTGRDTQRWVVSLLKKLANIAVHADGEIVCELSPAEGGDPFFEFYTVSQGELFVQLGHIVRGERKEV